MMPKTRSSRTGTSSATYTATAPRSADGRRPDDRREGDRPKAALRSARHHIAGCSFLAIALVYPHTFKRRQGTRGPASAATWSGADRCRHVGEEAVQVLAEEG